MDDAGNNNVDVVFDDRLLLLLLLLILEGCAHCLILKNRRIGEWDGCGETHLRRSRLTSTPRSTGSEAS